MQIVSEMECLEQLLNKWGRASVGGKASFPSESYCTPGQLLRPASGFQRDTSFHVDMDISEIQTQSNRNVM